MQGSYISFYNTRIRKKWDRIWQVAIVKPIGFITLPSNRYKKSFDLQLMIS